jgi:hypothetical protein
MNRKEFLELSKAVIGGLAIQSLFGEVASAQLPANDNSLERNEQDEFYLAKGLTGMAGATGWFDAHWGAAVLAGHYLCKENDLGEETTAAIRKQLGAMIQLRESQFDFFPEEAADKELIEEVPKALVPAIQGGLRAHGHAVIFASLSTRALRDAPHMAQPKLIQGLCGLSRQIAKINPQKSVGPATYANTQSMIEATFNSLARFEPLLGRPSVRRPNFTHMVTHTEALLNLHSMGYRELALAGHAGHKAHIAAPVPSFEPAEHPKVDDRATFESLMNKDYWASEENLSRWNKAWNESANPNGYWVAFGHLFKVLYSYHRLIDRLADSEKIRLCSTILLERYVNPAVQGG